MAVGCSPSDVARRPRVAGTAVNGGVRGEFGHAEDGMGGRRLRFPACLADPARWGG